MGLFDNLKGFKDYMFWVWMMKRRLSVSIFKKISLHYTYTPTSLHLPTLHPHPQAGIEGTKKPTCPTHSKTPRQQLKVFKNQCHAGFNAGFNYQWMPWSLWLVILSCWDWMCFQSKSFIHFSVLQFFIRFLRIWEQSLPFHLPEYIFPRFAWK